MILGAARMGWSLLVGAALGLARVNPRRLRPLDFEPFNEALERFPSQRDAQVGALVAGAPIARVRELMDQGQLTSEELTIHLLTRIRRIDPALGSVIELNPDALLEARAADTRRGSQIAVGPMHGIPVTVKDNIETAGPMHTTAGSMTLRDHVAARDAAVVTALREAGAVILGKTNLSELAGAVARSPGISAVGGQTRNPYSVRFTAGGSSSGSAVSVAASLCLASVGTETSGSLIAPAAFNGVVGMKPSAGLVSGEGIVPLVRFQDAAGPLACCVADAAALLDAMVAGGLGADLSTSSLQGITVGVLRADVLARRSPFEDTSDDADMLSRADDGLRRAGAVVKDARLIAEGGIKAFESGLTRIVLGGLSHDTVGYLAGAGAPVATIGQLHAFNLRQPRTRMPKGQFFVSLAQLFDIDRTGYEEAAVEQRAQARQILDETFAAIDAELLLSISDRHSSLYATAGYPAICVPLGLRANGMPTGATLIGPAGSDARLLSHAYAFEQATLLRVDPPQMSLRAAEPL